LPEGPVFLALFATRECPTCRFCMWGPRVLPPPRFFVGAQHRCAPCPHNCHHTACLPTKVPCHPRCPDGGKDEHHTRRRFTLRNEGISTFASCLPTQKKPTRVPYHSVLACGVRASCPIPTIHVIPNGVCGVRNPSCSFRRRTPVCRRARTTCRKQPSARSSSGHGSSRTVMSTKSTHLHTLQRDAVGLWVAALAATSVPGRERGFSP
jgi:hypothetical protein